MARKAPSPLFPLARPSAGDPLALRRWSERQGREKRQTNRARGLDPTQYFMTLLPLQRAMRLPSLVLPSLHHFFAKVEARRSRRGRGNTRTRAPFKLFDRLNQVNELKPLNDQNTKNQPIQLPTTPLTPNPKV
eukprot:scaffold154815_cov37-Tisochrysis_lutea.AAC.1